MTHAMPAAVPLTRRERAVRRSDPSGPAAASEFRLLALQNAAGNRAVARLVDPLGVQRQQVVTVSRLVQRGDKGAQVSDLQQKLNALGASPKLKVDGKFGPKTQAAVTKFQRAHAADGLTQTGAVDDPTRKVLDNVREIEPTEKELGKRIADDMQLANAAGTETSGLYYAENYRKKFGNTATGKALKPEDYAQGHANPEYFERRGYWDWMLRPNKSASEAVRAFLRGLTIAECNSVLVAIEMDAVRASLGDARFDELYGSRDVTVAENKRLHISPYSKGRHPSVEPLLVKTEAATGGAGPGTIGHRNVKIGEWYYFKNHPKYPEKHPGGSWQGENAVYLGPDKDKRQLWSGFGANRVTEQYMLNKLIEYYNRPSPAWTGSPSKINTKALLDAGGGLQLSGGLKLDAEKVRGMRK